MEGLDGQIIHAISLRATLLNQPEGDSAESRSQSFSSHNSFLLRHHVIRDGATCIARAEADVLHIIPLAMVVLLEGQELVLHIG
jgi:hypothetical protein